MARVSRDDTVTAVVTGVATMSVTVNGVTGSMPVAVTGPFSFDSPSIVEPGHPFSVTASLPHPAGAPPLHDVSMTLTVPDGWTVQPTSPTTFTEVAGGQTVRVTWQVTAPAGADPGTFPLSAQVAFTDANGRGSSQSGGSVALPYPSFTSAFNNIAVSDDGTNVGDIDGNGATYSA